MMVKLKFLDKNRFFFFKHFLLYKFIFFSLVTSCLFYRLGMEVGLVDPLNGVQGEVKQEALEEVIEMVIEVGINLQQKFDG